MLGSRNQPPAAKAGREPSFAPFFARVSTLKEFVDALVDGHRCAVGATAEFERFLQTTMVGHDPITTRIAFYEPIESLTDTVRKVVKQMLCRSQASSMSWGGQNMLAMGFSLRRDGGMNCMSSDSAITNHFINSSVVELGDKRWNQLLCGIGTEAMAFMLLHTALFLPLKRNGFCQISGAPLANLHMPEAERIKTADALFRLPENGASTRKRKRSAAAANDNGICRSARRIKLIGSVKHISSNDSLENAAGMDTRLALSTITIARGKMLFNAPSPSPHKNCWQLPTQFSLNRCTTPKQLLQDIFSKARSLAYSPPKRVEELAARMLKLHRKFNYRLRLFNACPASQQQDQQHGQQHLQSGLGAMASIIPSPNFSSSMDVDSSDIEMDPIDSGTEPTPLSAPPNFLEMASPHKSVYVFLQRCVDGVVPHDLVGGRHNHRRLYTLLRRLVSAGRFEELTLHEAVQRFRLGEVPWLDSQQQGAMDAYASLVFWILSEFAVKLISHFFYVTEGANSRLRLLFFRNDVWQAISRDAWRRLDADEMYAPMTYAKAKASSMKFGHSRMRLLPKVRGFRTIVNMRRSIIVQPRVGHGNGSYAFVPAAGTNRRLSDTLAALRLWQNDHPELFGSATNGPTDVHKRLLQFKETLNKAGVGTQQLFMAKLDIHHAYDTIPHDQLLALLRAHLPDNEIAVRRVWTLTPSLNRFRASFLRHAQPAGAMRGFGDVAREVSARGRGLVVGDQAATAYLHMHAIVNLIAEHVQHNIVMARSRLLRQLRGIPQGSVLSSLLCSFFYGQIEQQHLLPYLCPQRTLVLRMVDDFLVISTDRTQIVTAIQRIQRGLRACGCRLNTTKTLVNFGLSLNDRSLAQTTTAAFPWCGMLIDMRSLDVMVDYARMAPPVRLAETITINAGRQPGRMLRHKMLTAVRIKIHPLYVDVRLNAPHTVLLNLYQHFILCAKKFHIICCRLPAPACNADYLRQVMEDSIALAYILLRYTCRQTLFAPRLVKWLGSHAFLRVLRRKQTRYRQLVASLERALHHPETAGLAQKYAAVVDSPSNRCVLSIPY
ncbi:Telomerase reverse transcriptase [Coemansia sp. RSA 1085]|nr:Telomerase reverse transcriptase [Coemansia sp. RSA 1085]